MSNAQILGREVVRGAVLPEWIDVNNHMNVAYYVLAFDTAIDAVWEKIGITRDYINVSNSSTFAVESHITWQRELAVNAPYIITAQLLAYDEKRIHQFLRMYHADEHFLAATSEWLNLHIDLDVRKVAPWPDSIRAKIGVFAEGQGELEWPGEVGQRMSVPKPIFSSLDR